ncbi:hypothetical protein FB45DRAFT_1092618 [Roridomyces roridus]|uniref:FAD/NAD(P)-binding domain-containing protein n=1 Tax=Roridomyces roridus TaxID=1738132 RepID=A0AAD7FFH1_9AGAR|nr:hypothetical protein FB45DRAFT_1092618 [Roridomyces roridus]
MLFKIIFAIAALYSIALLSWRFFRGYLLDKNLGLPDLDYLHKRRPNKKKLRGTAVICGGSITGLLTARVCHDHFERVLVVEAEAWVASEEGRKIAGYDTKPRSRVVQSKSLHACQSFLFSGLEKLFPNIELECRRSSIAVLPSNPRFNVSGRLLRLPFSGSKSRLPKTMYVGRPGFETLLRRLVLDRNAYPNIEYMAGTVTDIRPDPLDHSRLNTVVIRTDTGAQEFQASLVADCSGPACAGMKWLRQNDYGYAATYPRGKLPLNELKIAFDQKLRYSTMTFRISPTFHDQLPFPTADYWDTRPIYTFLEGKPDKGRAMFVLTRPDGDRLVAFAGHHGDARSQPMNLEQLKEWVRELVTVQPIPAWVFELLDMLEEVQDSASVSLVNVAPTSYIRYHQATNLPSNWIALGDSVMTLNPIFGEGCTKAFRSALALHNVLRDVPINLTSLPVDFSSKFFAEQHDKTDWYWANTRLMDYGVKTTIPLPGERLSSGAYLRWYISHLQILAITDDQAGQVMYESAMGLASPIDAFHPNLVAKILWRACFGPRP